LAPGSGPVLAIIWLAPGTGREALGL